MVTMVITGEILEMTLMTFSNAFIDIYKMALSLGLPLVQINSDFEQQTL